MRVVTYVVAFLTLLLSASVSVAQGSGSEPGGNATPRSSFFKSASDLALGRFEQTDDALAMIKDEVWREILRKGGLNVFPQDGGKLRAELNTENLPLPESERAVLEQAGLPVELDKALISANLDVSQNAFSGNKLRGIDLENFDLELGEISVSGTGEMTADQSDKMQGTAHVTVVKWRQVLGLLDLPDENLRSQIEAGIAGFANGDSVELDVVIKDSKVMVGPLILGTLPEL